jgi:glycosyltransferase involved in cell wall biosynthesis
MRILHVTLGFYPAEGWGGPLKVAHHLCSNLVKRGHDVTIYCSNLLDKKHKIQPGTFTREIDGIKVIYFDTWNFPWWPGTLGPFWLPELPEVINREIKNFDVVHIHGHRTFMFIPVAQAARKAGVPFVIQPHGALPIVVNSFWVKRIYDRFFEKMELDGVSGLIALFDGERQMAIQKGIAPERIEMIPNGIDISKRDSLPERGTFRKKYGLSEDRPLILFLARINKMKGADMLVEAFAQMQNADAQLAIVGPDDGHLSEVKSVIDHYKLSERILLPGLLSGSDVLTAFVDADLFVLPSRVDTFPMAMVEACLAGTPMVVTENCGIANLVRGQVADVVPFDAEAFSKAMDMLLNDKEKYALYKTNTKKMLEETFSVDVIVNRIEDLYHRVVDEK